MSTSLIAVFKAKEEMGVLKTVGEMRKEALIFLIKVFFLNN